MEVYLDMFERLAEANEWPRDIWAVKLAAVQEKHTCVWLLKTPRVMKKCATLSLITMIGTPNIIVKSLGSVGRSQMNLTDSKNGVFALEVILRIGCVSLARMRRSWRN